MNGVIHHDTDSSTDYVEVDPTGRYGRYNEVLGKGSSKTVFRAFDEVEGIEVAWNQVKPNDFMQSPQHLERLYCEIHLLKTLKHENIMKMYAYWVDDSFRNVNFITEMFTSGTLRQYMLRHRKVNIRAVKHWCRQILRGLHYLHIQYPPVIHRDLKCDNIFINGNHGEVKIGDLGLAAVLRKSYADHCVGTPEFMAPEVYNEEYNELVDIYSFGMRVLEMVTLEFPYSECTTSAQIYKKVINGKKPDAFYKVKDPEVQKFVEKCLATVTLRLSARELLEDPFLQVVEYQSNSVLVECQRGFDGIGVIPRQLIADDHFTAGYSSFNRNYNGVVSEGENDFYYPATEIKPSVTELFEHEEDDNMHRVDISIKGQQNEDGEIFLRLRIVDRQERTRNIYFAFDIEKDTALSVATEMVAELDLSDHDETDIAKMIDGEIAALIPEWRSGASMDDDPCFSNLDVCPNCISNDTSIGSSRASISHSPCFYKCNTTTHGQFEEIVHQFGNTSEHEVMDNAPSVVFSSPGPSENHSHVANEDFNPSNSTKDKGEDCVENSTVFTTMMDFRSAELSGSRKDDIKGIDEQPRERQAFPKVGVLKTQGYEQKSVTSKPLRTSSFLPCFFPTGSVDVDDSDLWSLYNDILHRSF
ncbi:unnamed protein product [Rhodiola kirilowii]